MFKRKGGGVKGLLNNVQKKLHFFEMRASLSCCGGFIAMEVRFSKWFLSVKKGVMNLSYVYPLHTM